MNWVYKAYREVSGNLKLAYAQFEELESFIRFGTRIDDNTKKIINHGNRIRACFGQPELDPVPVPDQIMLLLALTNGLLENVPLEKIPEAEYLISKNSSRLPDDILKQIFSSALLSQTDKETILSLVKEMLKPVTISEGSNISSE